MADTRLKKSSRDLDPVYPMSHRLWQTTYLGSCWRVPTPRASWKYIEDTLSYHKNIPSKFVPHACCQRCRYDVVEVRPHLTWRNRKFGPFSVGGALHDS